MNILELLGILLGAYVMWCVWQQSRSLTARLFLSSILVYLGISVIFLTPG